MATAVSPPMAQISPTTSRSERPKVQSTMSYVSNRSRRSSNSASKPDLVETAKDKRRLEGKSDPTKALSEAQPAAVALEDSNLDDLRRVQHRDSEGNVITDPDRSNPTRNRMERPLDTIRSFNAAADGTSYRRASYQSRPASQMIPHDNQRRSSYYNSQPSPYSPQGRARQGYGGYYRSNSYGMRPDSFAEDGPAHQSFARPVRYPSAPYYPQADSPSSSHSQQHSYETVASGSDEFPKSTNPSSKSSSFDQLQQAGMRKPDGFNVPHDQENLPPQHRGYPPYAMRTSNYGQQPYPQPYQHNGPPPSSALRKPIQLGAPTSAPPVGGRYERPEPAKRQSWLKRTFSRRIT